MWVTLHCLITRSIDGFSYCLVNLQFPLQGIPKEDLCDGVCFALYELLMVTANNQVKACICTVLTHPEYQSVLYFLLFRYWEVVYRGWKTSSRS